MGGGHSGQRLAARRRDASHLVLCGLAALWSPVPGAGMAQQGAHATAPGAATEQSAPVDAAAPMQDTTAPGKPSSTETGHSPLDESFGPRTHADWVRDTRRQAWQDTKWNAQLRSYYLDRDKFDDSQSEAWSVGGSAGFETGYFRERFAFGATGYTSQKLYGPEDKDGTALLKPGQRSYTVLGELYGQFLLDPATRVTIGRRGFDTPYLNRNDSRMTPNTFQAATLQGLYGGEGSAEWRVGGGYFDRIKERNADGFVSMASAAGAPDGIERGVYAGGANFKTGDFSIGAIDYYSADLINIFYAETKYAVPVGAERRLQFALQYSDQRSTGDDLLRGTAFSSRQWGGKAELGLGSALFTAAYSSVAGDIAMQAPWGGYPGFTGVQMEDFNRAGEEAWMLRAAYDFQSAKGLSVYGLWVNGSDPRDPGQYAKDEYDVNLQWTPASGTLKGLSLRLRYAYVSQHDPAKSSLDDLRVMVYYDPAL